MEANKVHSKIIQFAVEEITFTKFYSFLMDSTSSNPIFVKWDKVRGGGEANQNVYWGPGPSGNATYDYEARDYMVVVSLTRSGEWRTINLQGVEECRWEGKRYRVR